MFPSALPRAFSLHFPGSDPSRCFFFQQESARVVTRADRDDPLRLTPAEAEAAAAVSIAPGVDRSALEARRRDEEQRRQLQRSVQR